MRRLTVERATPHFQLQEARVAPLADFDVVFMRKDPPFDMAYFFATHLLGLVDPAARFVLNEPRGLRDANEKLYALNFPEVIPESLVTADTARLKRLPRRARRRDDRQAARRRGRRGRLPRPPRRPEPERDARAVDARRHASSSMAQRYLPAVREGDKRIIVLDGEPLGAILRVPREDEHRGNIHVGGRVERVPVDERDREICRRMAPRLRADGLWFVGLDVIGGYVTEVNVTSPTGIQEIDRLDGVSPRGARARLRRGAGRRARPFASPGDLSGARYCEIAVAAR